MPSHSKRLFHFVAHWLAMSSVSLLVAPSPGFARANDSQIETSKPDPVEQLPPEGKLPRALVALSQTSPYALVVDKSLRTLTLWKWTGDKPIFVHAYPTDIGRNTGDKLSAGDRRTPEGVYFFQSVKEKNELDFNLYGVRAFTTDYPNYFDRLEKKTGNGIWLHAVPDKQTLWRGSKGCVVVRNKVIEELTPYIALKSTPMVVQKEVDYIASETWVAERAKMFAWLEDWKKAWETKDLDHYMTYYDENFESNGMNKTRWRKFKHSLGDVYSFIKVDLSEIQAFKHQGKFMIRFRQRYESDHKQDYGDKILYVQDSPSGLGIVGESWSPIHEGSLASSVTAAPNAQ